MIEIWMNGTRYRVDRPLCGLEWLSKHIKDHTHEEVESLTLEVSHDGQTMATVKANNGRGIIKGLVKLRR